MQEMDQPQTPMPTGDDAGGDMGSEMPAEGGEATEGHTHEEGAAE